MISPLPLKSGEADLIRSLMPYASARELAELQFLLTGRLEATEPAESKPLYSPRGATLLVRSADASEVVLSGPAGTGKTRGALEWLHELALAYPGSRALITRRERNSLTQTALVTFNKQVRPDLDGVIWRATEQEYRYPNGSVIVVGGLDKEGRKVFSGQYDHIYVNEATELEEAHWENLTTRLRNGKSPRPQILGDCNPDRPTHWLKVRSCGYGETPGPHQKTLMLESRHEDNPVLWDATAGDWTAEGRRYVLGVLEALSGPRKLRLRWGRWVRAEGVVYEGWDATIHLIDRFAVPYDWPRIWSIDFGYRNPFVWQEWALDGDNRLYLCQEIYHTNRIVDDHAERIRHLTATSPPPVAILCDHDAEDRATLERALGLPTTPAPKAKLPGIGAVQARLRVQGDGRPRLYVLRDALDERDEVLSEAKKPCRTEDEFDSYVWNDKTRKDEPVKEDDHGCFVAGTRIETDRGPRPIESIRPGDRVLTRKGFRPVLSAAMTARFAAVQTIVLFDGRTITCTPDHPFYLPAATNLVRADALRYGDCLLDVGGNRTWKSSSCQLHGLASSGCVSMASSTDDIPTPVALLIACTFAAELQTRGKASVPSTGMFGSATTAQSRTGTRSITRTATPSTISSATLNALALPSIRLNTSQRHANGGQSRTSKQISIIANAWSARLGDGTNPKLAVHGIPSMLGSVTPRELPNGTLASIAEAITGRRRSVETNTVLIGVVPQRVQNRKWTTSSRRALFAELISPSIDTLLCGIVRDLVERGRTTSSREHACFATPNSSRHPGVRNATADSRVLMRIEHNQRCPVFNLTVDGEHEYYANGVLVSNCDALRYVVYALDGAPPVDQSRTVLRP